MEVTSVKVYLVKNHIGKILAYAKITLDDELVLTNLRVVNGCKGVFVAYPMNSSNVDSYSQTFYPLTSNLRNKIETAVLIEYNKELKAELEKAPVTQSYYNGGLFDEILQAE